MAIRIYLVDDDELVTRSLATVLRLETDWEVCAYNHAALALADMGAAPPDVVLSDLKMPGMDGLALLRRVRAAFPDAVLLLLTGYADKDSAIAAINDVGLWHYVEKPWNTADLIVKVRQGLERRDVGRSLARKTEELAARVEELERTRAQLVQSERLAAVGRVMAGVAHEIGNQLGILGFAQLIVEGAADPEIAEHGRAILRAQRRLGLLVDEIKDFARGPSEFSRAVADIAEVAEEAAGLLRFDAEVRARVLTLEVRARPLALVHRGKILQALINLARNAAQASPVGGTVRVVIDAGPEGGARVEVIDAGSGMSPEVLARIGEPFYSARAGGSGLGVGISRRIAEEHNGALHYASSPGEGTTATLSLPPVGASAAPSPSSSSFGAAR
jgi:signal transduction histidine kinase